MPTTKYETDLIVTGGSGFDITKIRVGDKTLALTIDGTANDPPTGTVNFPITAKVSSNKRAKGIRPTIVVLRATATVGAYTAAAVVRVPLLNSTIKGKAALATNETAVSYGGTTSWQVSYVEDEVHK